MRDEGAHQGRENEDHVSLRIFQEMADQEPILDEARALLERRDALMRELESTPKDRLTIISRERFAKVYLAQRLHDLAREKMFPLDPPNHFCRHAIVGGILFYNTAGLACGDYKKLFEFGAETA